MVNTFYLKNIEKEFNETLNNIKKTNLEINNIKQITKKIKSKSQNNIFQKLINEKFETTKIIIKEDTVLNINGCANLNLEIEKNSTLELYFENNIETTININIIIKKNVKLNLIDFSNNTKLNKITQITLEENSILKTSQFDINSKININEIELKENSSYELKSAILSNNIHNYIINSSKHIEKNSKSDMIINTASKNHSQLICDGIVNITSNAPNSIGHQKISGLLIDDTSKILSEPILEIENNNVKCSHACSITQIKDEIKFYMKSKGLNEKEIINTIINGHFNLAIESIQNEKIKEKIKNKLLIKQKSTNLSYPKHK